MDFMPTKRNTDRHLLTNKLHSIRFHFEDFTYLIYEIAKLIIIICLFVLVIRHPKVLLFVIIPALFFVVPAILIRLFVKILFFVFRIFV